MRGNSGPALSFAAIRREEGFGLVLAVALHAGLLALLVLRPADRPPPLPERIAVTISDTVGLTDTSPQPRAQAAPETAPTLGEPAPAPVVMPEPQPEPKPVVKPSPRLQPEPQPVPKPVARPSPAPRPVAVAKPSPAPAKPVAVSRNRPDPIAEALAGSRSAPAKTEKPVKTPGGSRIGSDFLKGIPGGQSTGKATTPPAAAIGPEVVAGLKSAIARQLKPHWVSPQGAEIEQLVTVVMWNLNPDGSLDGAPRVVRQQGITESNRAQAQRHAEQAIRAVRLAAPFDLPPQYYETWKRPSFSFDRKLSQ